jgi:hypothetical protein
MAPQGAEVSMLAPEIVRQIRDLKDFDGLWRRPEDVIAPVPALPPGRSLADYAAAIGGAP